MASFGDRLFRPLHKLYLGHAIFALKGFASHAVQSCVTAMMFWTERNQPLASTAGAGPCALVMDFCWACAVPKHPADGATEFSDSAHVGAFSDRGHAAATHVNVPSFCLTRCFALARFSVK